MKTVAEVLKKIDELVEVEEKDHQDIKYHVLSGLLKEYCNRKLFKSNRKKAILKILANLARIQVFPRCHLLIESINALHNKALEPNRTFITVLTGFVTRYPECRAQFNEWIRAELPEIVEKKPVEEEKPDAPQVIDPKEKIEQFKAECEPPDEMTCGITLGLSPDLIITTQGQRYSLEALRDWVRSSNQHQLYLSFEDQLVRTRCPLTKHLLTVADINTERSEGMNAIVRRLATLQQNIYAIIEKFPETTAEEIEAEIALFNIEKNKLLEEFNATVNQTKEHLIKAKKEYYMAKIPAEFFCALSEPRQLLTKPVITENYEIVNQSAVPEAKPEINDLLKETLKPHEDLFSGINNYRLGDDAKLDDLIMKFEAEQKNFEREYSNAHNAVKALSILSKFEAVYNQPALPFVRPTLNNDCQLTEGEDIFEEEPLFPSLAKLIADNKDRGNAASSTIHGLIKLYSIRHASEFNQKIPDFLCKIADLKKENDSFPGKFEQARVKLIVQHIRDLCASNKAMNCARTARPLDRPVLLPDKTIVSLTSLTENELISKQGIRLNALDKLCDANRKLINAMSPSRIARLIKNKESFHLVTNQYKTLFNQYSTSYQSRLEAIKQEQRPSQGQQPLDTQALIDNLKIDMANEAHLKFWSYRVSKVFNVKVGYEPVAYFDPSTFQTRTYLVPARVAKMMRCVPSHDHDLTLNQFIQQLDKARTSRSSFFKSPLETVNLNADTAFLYSAKSNLRAFK